MISADDKHEAPAQTAVELICDGIFFKVAISFAFKQFPPTQSVLLFEFRQTWPTQRLDRIDFTFTISSAVKLYSLNC